MDVGQLSDSQHKEQHMKRDYARHAFLTDVICSVREVAFSFHVCVREMGLLPWPYHANPLSRICSRLVSVPNCSQTALGMFLIQSCRFSFQFIPVSFIQ